MFVCWMNLWQKIQRSNHWRGKKSFICIILHLYNYAWIWRDRPIEMNGACFLWDIDIIVPYCGFKIKFNIFSRLILMKCSLDIVFWSKSRHLKEEEKEKEIWTAALIEFEVAHVYTCITRFPVEKARNSIM